MKPVLVDFVALVVRVGRWLVGVLASVVPGWWKTMPSSTSWSANASYRLLIVGFQSALLLGCCQEPRCRPVVWLFFVIIGICFLRWLWSRRCCSCGRPLDESSRTVCAVGGRRRWFILKIHRIVLVFVFKLAIKPTISRKLVHFGRSLHYLFYLASLASSLMRLFFVWYLSVRGGISLSLVAVFDRAACLPTNLAYQLLVVPRVVFCGLLSVSSLERSILSITGFLTAFWLLRTKFVTIEAPPFKFFRSSTIWRLWQRLWFSFIFHRSRLMKWLRHCDLCNLVVLLASVLENLVFFGVSISFFPVC